MAHLETPPQRSGGSARKVRELLGVDLAVAEEASPPPPPSVTLPVRLPRGPNSHEMAPKYETRVYTPTMGTLFDLSVQEDKEEDDEDDTSRGEMASKHTINLPMHPHSPAYVDNSHAEMDMSQLEYPDDAPTIPGVPPEFLQPHPHHQRSSFDESTSSSEELDEFALPSLIEERGDGTKAIETDGRPMASNTGKKMVASLRRHLSMRTMREKFGSMEAIKSTLRLPVREVNELIEWKPPAGTVGGGEGSLARRLLGRKKKPKRPPVPKGWFGPPLE